MIYVSAHLSFFVKLSKFTINDGLPFSFFFLFFFFQDRVGVCETYFVVIVHTHKEILMKTTTFVPLNIN